LAPHFFTEVTLNIEPNFEPAIKNIFIDALKQREFSWRHAIDRITLFKQNMVIKRLNSPEIEIPRMLSNLEQLPYTAFGVRKGANNQTFLVGVTKPIFFIRSDGCKNRFSCLGPYLVGIPTTGIIKENLADFHFVPLLAMNSLTRHYHHVVIDTYGKRYSNPLNSLVSTCWASIAPLMINALNLVDIRAIFETAYLFLIKIDPKSVLCIPDHEITLTSTEYAKKSGVPMSEIAKVIYKDITEIF